MFEPVCKNKCTMTCISSIKNIRCNVESKMRWVYTGSTFVNYSLDHNNHVYSKSKFEIDMFYFEGEN